MEIIKFEKNTLDDEIFAHLRGKPFFAVSAVRKEDGGYLYKWYSHDLPEEVIIFGLELLKKDILDEED